MKMNHFFLLSTIILLILFSACTTTNIMEPEYAPSSDNSAVAVPVTASSKTEEIQENINQTTVPLTEEDAEYLRSTVALDATDIVSKDTFTQDKKDILDMIDLLETAMRTNNYAKWRSYLTPASITYWQNPRNLREIESRLPVAGLKVNDLQDYFKYIFVPARAGRQVDEIRYISSTQVKAVQVQDHTDIVYYTFEKINGKWMLNLVPEK